MSLVSPEYQQQIQSLHQTDPSWGTSGRKLAPVVQRIIQDYKPLNVLDYGCGKQTLARALPHIRIKGYDPGIPSLEASPEPVDLVICTDVLEHIEPDCLEDVLDDLQRITKENIFLTVSTAKALAILPDGRNAHLIVEPVRWWLPKFLDRFDPISFAVLGSGFHMLLEALKPKGNGLS